MNHPVNTDERRSKSYSLWPFPKALESSLALFRGLFDAKWRRDHYLNHGSQKPLHAKHVQLILDQFVRAYKERHPKPVIEAEVPQPDGRRGAPELFGEHRMIAFYFCA